MRNIDSYLDGKLKSNQQTPVNKADPKMSVQVSRARTTVMDADYWKVETIRQKEGLGEVGVTPRRERPYGSPNRIFEIHVDSGTVGTAIREYPDTFEEGWKNQFVLGPGSSVAIAFDGYWSRFRKLWRLVTEEKPWIFWVDNNNILWRQLWDDESTKNQLAADVLKVKALRAWKNVNLPDRDQGIVVGYIKTDGTVWYRNYCQQEDYSYVWESPKQVTQFNGTAITLNLFITNDYRMGFIIEDTAKQIHWIITPRNWAGMALEQHILLVKAAASVGFIPVKYHQGLHEEQLAVSASSMAKMLFGRTDNTIVGLENLPMTRLNEEEVEYQDWGFIVRITLDYFAVNTPHVVLMDTEWNAPIPVTYVEEVEGSGGFQFDVYIDEEAAEFGMNTVLQTVAVEVSDAWNEAGYLHDTMMGEFTPLNLVFPDLPLPEVEVIWNE